MSDTLQFVEELFEKRNIEGNYDFNNALRSIIEVHEDSADLTSKMNKTMIILQGTLKYVVNTLEKFMD